MNMENNTIDRANEAIGNADIGSILDCIASEPVLQADLLLLLQIDIPLDGATYDMKTSDALSLMRHAASINRNMVKNLCKYLPADGNADQTASRERPKDLRIKELESALRSKIVIEQLRIGNEIADAKLIAELAVKNPSKYIGGDKWINTNQQF